MDIFEVGGAVRDALLGLPVEDRDWVVVGSTPEEMVLLGFKPVGKDFPVFLHPDTHEEYALARTERKVAPGYHGFLFHADPSVSLEEDLARRDLTINAMAKTARGELIDPFGGQDDLKARLLRHVSPAFSEDPVRILRVARFAARFDFQVADTTLALMAHMVHEGEVSALVPERVAQEFFRALMESRVDRFFEVLDRVGALPVILPEALPLMQDLPLLKAGFERAAHWNLGRSSRIALLAFLLPACSTMGTRLKWPTQLIELARFVSDHRATLMTTEWHKSDAARLLDLFEAGDAFRRPQKMEEALPGAACLVADPVAAKWAMATVLKALQAARGLDSGAIAAEQPNAAAIPAALRAERLAAIAATLA